MQIARPTLPASTRRFGRGPVRVVAAAAPATAAIGDEFKLFATTFLAGFVFVSLLIA